MLQGTNLLFLYNLSEKTYDSTLLKKVLSKNNDVNVKCYK